MEQTKRNIVYITGVSGSGKSYVVEKLKRHFIVASFDGIPFDLNKKIFPFGKPLVWKDTELVRKLHEKIPGHFSALKPIRELLSPLIETRIQFPNDNRNLPIVFEGVAFQDEFWRNSITESLKNIFKFSIAEETLIFHNPPVDTIKRQKDNRRETDRPREPRLTKNEILRQQQRFQKNLENLDILMRETNSTEETVNIVFKLSGVVRK